jgi:hypothetical protein
MKKIILLVATILLSACGEPLTDEMVKAVGETCKENNRTLYVSSPIGLAECR